MIKWNRVDNFGSLISIQYQYSLLAHLLSVPHKLILWRAPKSSDTLLGLDNSKALRFGTQSFLRALIFRWYLFRSIGSERQFYSLKGIEKGSDVCKGFTCRY